MKNPILKISLSTLILFITSFAMPAAPSATEIVKQADLARMPEGDVRFTVKVQDYKGKKKLRETTYDVAVKGTADSLVETISPARQKGRKLLMKGDDLWFFTPDLKRPTRVSMQQRLTGEVANGDLARTNFSGDYDSELVGEEVINNKKSYKLNLVANRKGVTYSKVTYWVSADKDSMPLKAEFYATGGKLLKRAIYSGEKQVLDRKRVTLISIADAVNGDSKSELVYTNFKKVNLDASLFNKDALSD